MGNESELAEPSLLRNWERRTDTQWLKKQGVEPSPINWDGFLFAYTRGRASPYKSGERLCSGTRITFPPLLWIRRVRLGRSVWQRMPTSHDFTGKELIA